MKGGLSDQEQERHRPRQRSAVGQEVPLPSQAPTDCCPFRKRSLAGVCAYSRENPGPGGRGSANGGRRPSKLPAKYGPPQSRRLLRRFRAKPDKKIVDGQAASPSSWKTPFIATCMVW